MNEKDQVKEVFAKNSEAYVTSSTHSQGKDLVLIKEWLSPTADSIILDIATGGGHVAKQLSPYVKMVIATDITREMLENTSYYLKDYLNIMYVVADAESLPFLDSTFDIITCRIAAHHFPNPFTFIKEVQRLLKPGGKFLLIDNVAAEDSSYDLFYNKLEKMRDYSHVRAMKILEWKEILKKYKLTITKEISRKKTLPYTEWVNRTLDNDKTIEKVHQYLLDATDDLKDYYSIKINQQKIKSFSIDEWMVMCEN